MLGGRRGFAADPIRIGATLPLSGTAEIVGTKQKLGIEIARDQINAAGGVIGRPIEIVFRDDRGDPNQAVAAARDLTSSGVNLIVGPSLSALCIAVTGVIQSLNGIIMTPSSPLEALTHELFNRNFFRCCDNGYMRARALARVMAQRFPQVTQWGATISDISIGHDSWREFSTGLREFYPAHARTEPTILDPTTARFGTTDYRTQIFRVMQSPAQGVFNLTFGSDMISLWRQAKTLGLSDRLKVVADGAGELDLPVILGKDMPTEMWSNLHWYFGSTGRHRVSDDLVREVRSRTNDNYPSSLIGTAHAAVLCYAAAIQAANGTATPAVIEALENITVETAKGAIRFRKEDHQQIGAVSVIGSAPTGDSWRFTEHVEVAGSEIAEAPTPGVALRR
jgi:branched-chain amino acid transport system substrate-binding protein